MSRFASAVGRKAMPSSPQQRGLLPTSQLCFRAENGNLMGRMPTPRVRPSLPVSWVTKRKGKMALKNVALCSSHPHLSTLASAPGTATAWRRKQPKAKERSETGEGHWAERDKQ